MERKRGRPSRYSQKISKLQEDDILNDYEFAQTANDSVVGELNSKRAPSRGRPSRYWKKIEELKDQEAKWNQVKHALQAPDDSSVIKAMIDKSAWALYDETLSASSSSSATNLPQTDFSPDKPVNDSKSERETEVTKAVEKHLQSMRTLRPKTTKPSYNYSDDEEDLCSSTKRRRKSLMQSKSASVEGELHGGHLLGHLPGHLSSTSSIDKIFSNFLSGADGVTDNEGDLSPLDSLIKNVQLPSNLLITSASKMQQPAPAASATVTSVPLPNPISVLSNPLMKAEEASKKMTSVKLLSNALAHQSAATLSWPNPKEKTKSKTSNKNKKEGRRADSFAPSRTQPAIVIAPKENESGTCNVIDVGECFNDLNTLRKKLQVQSFKDVVKILLDNYRSKSDKRNNHSKDHGVANSANSLLPQAQDGNEAGRQAVPEPDDSCWCEGPVLHIPYRLYTHSSGARRLMPISSVLDLLGQSLYPQEGDLIARPHGEGRLQLEPLLVGNPRPRQPSFSSTSTVGDLVHSPEVETSTQPLQLSNVLGMAVFPEVMVKMEVDQDAMMSSKHGEVSPENSLEDETG